MKKIGFIVLIMMILGSFFPVYAENYKVKELIPNKVQTTIVTKSFSYQKFYYDGEGHIVFQTIKNISHESLPISISVGLFDKKEKNIGTVLYCSSSDTLLGKEGKPYSIDVEKYLTDGKKLEDIHYIAVLDENKGCRTTGKNDFVGKKVEEIGVIEDSPITNDVLLFLKVIGGVGVFLIILFFYKVLFTNSYNNMNGDDVRKGYQKWSKENAEKKKLEQPVIVEEKKSNKSEEIKKQEKLEKEKEKDSTDLHQLYK